MNSERFTKVFFQQHGWEQQKPSEFHWRHLPVSSQTLMRFHRNHVKEHDSTLGLCGFRTPSQSAVENRVTFMGWFQRWLKANLEHRGRLSLRLALKSVIRKTWNKETQTKKVRLCAMTDACSVSTEHTGGICKCARQIHSSLLPSATHMITII